MAFNSNPGKQQFTATAGQTVFNFNFAIFADTDIKVYKTLAGAIANDTTDILTISTHYTVSINGTLGGTVTLLTGAGLNDTVTIVRSLPVSRTTDYVTNGDLYADTLDADQDYQTYLVQDGYVQLERAIIVPESISGVNLDIPAPVGNSYLRWNTAGDALENDTTIPQALVDAQTAATNSENSAIDSAASAAAALVSEANAALSAAAAAASALSVNDTNLVHITGTETITGAKTFTQPISFEGSTVDSFQTTLAITDPTADRTITFPNRDITVAGIDNCVGLKNYLINGNFDVWQYATSQTSSGYGSDDRWQNNNSGSTKTHSQVASTDTERALFNASYFSRTAVTSVAGVANFALKAQYIENVTKLAGKTVTISFLAKADASKNIAISLSQGFGTGGTPSAGVLGIGSQLVALTSTWQKKTITVSIPSIVGKTLGTDGVHTSSTVLNFWFDAGSNYNTQTASLGQQSGTFDIAQVQIEEGTVATPFEQRPYGLELSLCQRYLPSIGYVGGNGGLISGLCASTTQAQFGVVFPVFPRVVPTGITVSGVTHFSISAAGGVGAPIQATNITWAGGGLHAGIQITVASGLVQGQASLLFPNNVLAKILFTGCEL